MPSSPALTVLEAASMFPFISLTVMDSGRLPAALPLSSQVFSPLIVILVTAAAVSVVRLFSVPLLLSRFSGSVIVLTNVLPSSLASTVYLYTIVASAPCFKAGIVMASPSSRTPSVLFSMSSVRIPAGVSSAVLSPVVFRAVMVSVNANCSSLTFPVFLTTMV